MSDEEPQEPSLFPLPDAGPAPVLKRKASPEPVWTEYKASLIARYLYLFVQVTHHGTYIDGFAGPQYPERQEHWAARQVLGIELLQHFHLFEIDAAKLRLLEELKAEHPGKDVAVHPVDFNTGVHELLRPEVIPHKQATFCLIDQHTFECRWDTVRAIASYKAGGYKIELFYFLGTGWLERAVRATTKNVEKITNWWGGTGYQAMRKLSAPELAYAFSRRVHEELGYAYVFPWAIHEKAKGGRIMYFMVHASDHPDAPNLMFRAYGDVQPHAPVPEKLSLF